MVRYKVLKIGDSIETEKGYEIITGYNGHIVYTDSFTVEIDGTETKDPVDGRFTLEEIAGLLHDMTGKNYKVIIDL